MPPAPTKRQPLIKNGGIDRTPTRMARYVDPQMRYTAAKASAVRSGGLADERGG
jgi:hypothetical protein